MENERTNGQYGKRNPLFLYQGTAGHSIRAEVGTCAKGEQKARAFTAEPAQSGQSRCGALQNEGKE